MHDNWLLVGWAFEKSFWRTTFIFTVFPLFPLSPIPLVSFSCHFLTFNVPCLTSLLVSRPMSSVLRPCFLSPILWLMSHVSLPCLPSAVPSHPSLFLVSRTFSPVSRLCSLSPVICTLSYMICLPSSFLSPLTPIHWPSVPFSVAIFWSSFPSISFTMSLACFS